MPINNVKNRLILVEKNHLKYRIICILNSIMNILKSSIIVLQFVMFLYKICPLQSYLENKTFSFINYFVTTRPIQN